MMKVFEAILCV